MRKLWFASSVRLGAILLAASLTVPFAQAQKPTSTPAPDSKKLLAQAASLYYSSAKAGLEGFDCAVHPQWRALFLSANPGGTVAADDSRIVLLNNVKIKLHARMKGGSTLEWNTPAQPGKPLDQTSTTLLSNMHAATEQTLQGFMQFWTPFVDGSAVPDSPTGIEVTQTGNETRIHAEDAGTSVTEVLDINLVLQEYDVVMKGMVVKLAPAYRYTEKGLLVNGFLAHITQSGTQPAQTQEMHVEIDYQTVDGFPIPGKLKMIVVGTGEFDFVMDGCTVTHKPK